MIYSQVLLTSKFRDSLTTPYLPKIPTVTWLARPPHFSDTWQFTLVYSWLDRLIVTLQDKMLWILDPENIAVAGVLQLEHAITAITIHDREIYVLCGGVASPLMRLSIHPQFERAVEDDRCEVEEAGTPDGGQVGGGVGVTPQEDESQQSHLVMESISRDESPEEQPSEETEVTDGAGDENTTVVMSLDDAIDKPDLRESPFHEPHEQESISTEPHRDEIPALVPPLQPRLKSPTTPSETTIGSVKAELKELSEKLKPALGVISGLLHYPRGLGRPSEDEKEGVQEESSGQQGSGTTTPAEQHHDHTKADLRDLLRLDKSSVHQGDTSLTAPSGRSAPPVDSREQERRLRMAQAQDGDEVVVASGKTHRRKKKKRVVKKTSSKSSEWCVCV